MDKPVRESFRAKNVTIQEYPLSNPYMDLATDTACMTGSDSSDLLGLELESAKGKGLRMNYLNYC
jgi:hypothetical protein